MLAALLLAFLPSVNFAKLQADREWLFEQTRDLGGYFYGPEGSARTVYFPAGRSDRLYYIAYNDEKRLATCYQRNGGRFQLEWQFPLVANKRIGHMNGSLAKLVIGPEMAPRTSGAEWSKARGDFEKQQRLVAYDVGEHGDFNAIGRLYSTNGDLLDRFNLFSSKALGNGSTQQIVNLYPSKYEFTFDSAIPSHKDDCCWE
ncbi:MAG: hypothetical protein ACAH95_12075 [Fimbriimonas sp.]